MSTESGSNDPELDRSAELIERLLSDPALRARFREDPASVLYANGLTELADGLGTGPKALMTLELRESRSSLAGVMVAAAAEGVDVGHIAEHALPHLGRSAGHAVSHLMSKLSKATQHKTAAKPAAVAKSAAPVKPVAAPKPAAPDLSPTSLPKMATPVHHEAAQPTTATEPTVGEPTGTEPTTAEPVTDDPTANSAATEAIHHAADSAVSAEPVNLLQYPGNDASQQQVAAWMGANAQQAGLPAELPVMAALTESGLHNVDYGTDDSVGFFQMRTSIWNEGPYAGFYSNPELQMKWFIQEALAAKHADPSLADSSSTWGEWVANIERPAAQYRYRYQLQLGEAQDLLKGATLTSYTPEATTAAATSATESANTGEMVSSSAAPSDSVVSHQAGTTSAIASGAGSAASGAATPMPTDLQGADFVHATYARDGLQLPQTTAAQFDVGSAVSRENLQAGDAVFFGSSGTTPSKVGLYVGNGQVSMGSGGHIESLSSLAKAGERYLGARRYTSKSLSGSSSYARVLPTIQK